MQIWNNQQISMKFKILFQFEYTGTNEEKFDFFHLVQFQHFYFVLLLQMGVVECPSYFVQFGHLLHFLHPDRVILSHDNNCALYFLMQDMHQFGQRLVLQVSHTFKLITILQPATDILDLISNLNKLLSIRAMIIIALHIFLIEQMLEIFVQAHFDE